MTRRKKLWTIVLITFLVLVILGVASQTYIRNWLFRTTNSTIENGVTKSNEPNVKIVSQNLIVPWEVAILPGGDLLVTERPGTVKRIGKNQQIYTISGVHHVGEGGLLGMALHPKFSQNNFIYLYLTTKSGEGLINRVERYKLGGNSLSDRRIIVNNIPGEANHDGGRIAFGPDSNLYITTGDAGQPELAQSISSLAGKILRLKDDGSIPSDNPYNNAVYSYGHRNPQGIAWDNKGQLWATEHGRSGLASGYDELNLISKGGNYGWPTIQGDETRSGMINPITHSGPNETWAPAGMAFFNGSLYFSGLRGQTLYEAIIGPNNSVSLKAHFRKEYGRLRGSVIGSDKFLYITTSNRDGRGSVKANDDKIIRINPDIFRD